MIKHFKLLQKQLLETEYPGVSNHDGQNFYRSFAPDFGIIPTSEFLGFHSKYWVFLLYQFLCLDFVIICFIFISVCVFNCDLISIDLISLFAFLSFPSVGFPVYAARFYFQPFGVLFLWKRRSKKQLGGETARHQTQNVHKYITVHASAQIQIHYMQVHNCTKTDTTQYIAWN